MCEDQETENARGLEGEALGGSVLLHRALVLPTEPTRS